MIKLNKYEQQIILATKGWSKWTKKEGRLKGIQVVVSQYYDLDLKELPMSTTYNCLLELFLKINANRTTLLQEFLENIFYKDWSGGYVEIIDMEHLVKKLISQISNMPVRDNKGNNYYEELECDYEILNKGYEEE